MTWDRRFYFPYEGRRAEEFFALKNPTASAGFQLKASRLTLDHLSRYLVIYTYSTNIPTIVIINKIYENQNLLSL